MQIYQMLNGRNEVEQEGKAGLVVSSWIQSRGFIMPGQPKTPLGQSNAVSKEHTQCMLDSDAPVAVFKDDTNRKICHMRQNQAWQGTPFGVCGKIKHRTH